MAEIILAASEGPSGFVKLVVLKRIWPELTSDAEFVAMFLDEAKLCARFNHPNVVQTFEIVHDVEDLTIVMEFLEGQPLHHVLNRLHAQGSELPLAVRGKLVADILAGLDHAHDLRDWDGRHLKVVHRDVSPQNVFVTYGGETKLMDFGIAKSLAASHHTRPGVLKGRLSYMAPEQIRGGEVDHRADLFSVGVVLWELLAGRRLWRGKTEGEIARFLTGGEPIGAPVVPWKLPEGMEEICRRALALDPRDRYHSAAAFHDDLLRCLPGLGETLSRHLGKVVSGTFAVERRRLAGLIEERLRGLSEGRRFSELHEVPPEARVVAEAEAQETDFAAAPARWSTDSAIATEQEPSRPPPPPPPPRRRPRDGRWVQTLVLSAVVVATGGVLAARQNVGRQNPGQRPQAATGARSVAEVAAPVRATVEESPSPSGPSAHLMPTLARTAEPAPVEVDRRDAREPDGRASALRPLDRRKRERRAARDLLANRPAASSVPSFLPASRAPGLDRDVGFFEEEIGRPRQGTEKRRAVDTSDPWSGRAESGRMGAARR
jgi:serine/threonine-protein kinase